MQFLLGSCIMVALVLPFELTLHGNDLKSLGSSRLNGRIADEFVKITGILEGTVV